MPIEFIADEVNKECTFKSLLARFGYDIRDFSVEEHHGSSIANALSLDGGIVTVRRVSTGEERLYATGEGSAWFGAFVMDLGWGRFGRTVVAN